MKQDLKFLLKIMCLQKQTSQTMNDYQYRALYGITFITMLLSIVYIYCIKNERVNPYMQVLLPVITYCAMYLQIFIMTFYYKLVFNYHKDDKLSWQVKQGVIPIFCVYNIFNFIVTVAFGKYDMARRVSLYIIEIWRLIANINMCIYWLKGERKRSIICNIIIFLLSMIHI